MNTLIIYRAAAVYATVDIDEKTVFKRKLMGEHRISTSFIWPSVLGITIGDYVIYDTENYYVNRIPGIKKINNTAYEYTIDFEAVGYDLCKKMFMSTDKLTEFGQSGTATDFITMIVTNMNVNYSGWTVGTVDTTEIKTIVFSNQYCDAVLMKVAETFKLEFRISGKAITMVKAVGSNTAYSFTYGKTLGLYNLTRQQVGDMNIVTKVYGFGSMQNIPFTYRDRAKRLVFSTDRGYTSPPVGYGGGDRFLTKNTELYGIMEGQYTNDDIFPNRTGTVTDFHVEIVGGIYNAALSYIEDSALDFDINNYRLEGATWMVVFKTGYLAGKEYPIARFDYSTKRIYLNPYSEEDGYTTPNSGVTGQPAISDTYTIVNISLPKEYIDSAEESLLAATQAWLDENSIPKVVYTIEIDPKYAKLNSIHLAAGDRVTIVDSALGVNSLIRISAIEYPMTDLYSIKAVIADSVPYTLTERIIHGTQTNITETRIVDRSADELTRRWATRQNQLFNYLFDPDGYLDPVHIKPLTIETMALSVGVKSMNFHLNGVRIKPNWNETTQTPDANAIWVSAGQLVHNLIEIEGLGYTWVIQDAEQYAILEPGTAYYLYARCSTGALTGEWILSADQNKVDYEAGYYNFLVGVLYPVLTDDIGSWRDFSFLYGATYINGREITTGRIQSLNRLNYFDLDTNQFRIGDSTYALEWNKDQDGILRLIGTLIQRSPDGDAFPVMLYRGAYLNTTTYFRGDQVTFNGTTWVYIYSTPTSGNDPVAGMYWELVSSIGTQGDSGASPVGVFRGTWSIGADYYGTLTRVDIVYNEYDQLYYIAKPKDTINPFRGLRPDQYPEYWSNFGAQFESIATKVLFAENAFLDNVGVRYFEGLPVGVGNLYGEVVNTQANVVGVPRVDRAIIISGTSGSANITVSGVQRLCTWISSRAETAAYFVYQWYTDYLLAGVLISHGINVGVDDHIIYFTEVNGEDFSGSSSWTPVSGDISGQTNTMTAHSAGQKQIDTITLRGTGGSADVVCNGMKQRLLYYESLHLTADAFVQNYATSYLNDKNVVVTADTSDPDNIKIVFTARYASQGFVGDTTITNIPSDYSGAISIAGNEIWEDKTNSDVNSGILINMKGYQGGTQYARKVLIGNGKGIPVISIGGDAGNNNDFIEMTLQRLRIAGLPRSTSGLQAGEIYIDANNNLKYYGG